mgnify:CR=1 FL=1
MKPIKHLAAAVSTCMFIMAGTTAWAATLDGSQYLKDARITLSQARAKASKVYPGKIVAQELEKEPGGSGLRYSFCCKFQVFGGGHGICPGGHLLQADPIYVFDFIHRRNQRRGV